MLTSLVDQQNKNKVQEDGLKLTPIQVVSLLLLYCKLRSLTNHSILHCKLYSNFDKRCQRAQQLGMCNKCLSKRHTEMDCPGLKGKLPFPSNSCKATEHVTLMCKNIMLSLSSTKRVSGNGVSTSKQ